MTKQAQQPQTQEPRERIDESLITKSHHFITQLLTTHPELRSVVIVFDYDMKDPGSLPPGTWVPRRDLTPYEALGVCKSVDKVALSIRAQHDDAILKRFSELEKNITEIKNASQEKDEGPPAV